MRFDGVCLDEISFARFARPPIPIVPVMAVACEPPFCIFRLDYTDLTRWSESEDQYRIGFQRLLGGIEAALRGETIYRHWHHQLQPLEFELLLDEKRRDFTGRRWLRQQLCEAAGSNFLYVQQALLNPERGRYRFDQLDRLPQGLDGIYADFFQRCFPRRASYRDARAVLGGRGSA